MGLLSLFGSNCNAQKQSGKKGYTSEPQFISNRDEISASQVLRYRPEYESELKALIATDTLWLLDRKYVNHYQDTPAPMLALTAEEKQIVTDAYENGVFEPMDYNIYDENGNLGFISGTGIAAHGEPSAPSAYYAYLFVTKDKKVRLPYNYGCFNWHSTSYTVQISTDWRARIDAILQKYCPDSFSKSENWWREQENARD